MSDILLTVDYEFETDLSSSVSSLISKINADPPKIKIDFDLSKTDVSKLKKELTSSFGNLNIGTGKISSKAVQSYQSGFSKSVVAAAKEAALATKQIATERSKAEKLLSSLGSAESSKNSTKYKEVYSNAENYIKEINSLASKFGVSESGEVVSSLSGSYKEFGTELTSLQTKYVSLKDAASSYLATQKESITGAKQDAAAAKENSSYIEKYYKLLAKNESALKNYSAAKLSQNSSGAYRELESQKSTLLGLKDIAEGGKANAEFAEAVDKASASITNNTNAIRANDDAHETLTGKIGSAVQKFGSWLSISQAVMTAIRTVKQMVSVSVELDTAMTELKKVTDETDATYTKFLSNAPKRAASMGASVADTVTATADFARLGYNLSEAENLADASIVYKNVGDGIESISDASDSIISTMQAFGVSADDAMTIVDKFNEVGNNYAISSEGIGEAMLKSASSMNAAGNSLDETIALITAANTVVQNPESVGTTLKTVSMYLRAAKTEAESAGEETDGMASSVSELRDEILSLTGQKVDIQLDEDNFKSTYEILKEISEVWDSLSDISQANLTELMGGKRNGNVISALMENFSVAEKVLKTSSEDYEGSALKENEKYLDSIQGRLGILKAEFESISSTVADADMLKFFVSAAAGALKLADALVKVVDSFGGFKTLLISVGGTALAKNFTALSSYVTKFGENFTKKADKAREKISTLVSEFNKAREAGSGMSESLSKGLSAANINPVSAGIGAITAAVSIAVAAYSRWRNQIEQARVGAISNSQSSASEANSVMDLYSAYQQAQSAYSAGTGSKEELTSATNELLSALGYEESQISSLASQYGNLDTAINSVTGDTLKKAAEDALSGYKATYENLQDEFGNGGDVIKALFNNKGVVSWTESNFRVAEKVKNLLSKYTSEGSIQDNASGEVYLGTNSLDSILESYNTLLEMKALLQEGLTSEEYANSDAAESIEAEISIYEDAVGDYLDARDLLNESQAKSDIFENLNKNGIPETVEEYNSLKQTITDAALASDDFVGAEEDITEAVNDAFDELSSDIPALSDLMKSVGKTAQSTSSEYQKAANLITKSVSEAGESATNLISGINSAWSAINSQQNGKSISYGTFSADELKDYQAALEYTNGTMQLNAERVREIAKAKAEEEVATNNTNKALEQTKYLENAKQIERLREALKNAYNTTGGTAVSVDAINAQIDALLDENSTIAETCKQYDLLSASIQEAVGSYQNWLNAQSASDYGDMENDAVSAIQKIRDTYDEDSDIYGYFGSKKFDAAVEFIIPDSVDSDDIDAIESYMNSFQEYLNIDDDGNVAGLNVDRFLDKSVENGLMSYEDGIYDILDGIKTEDFADKLGLSGGVVQAMFDQLQLQGGEFSWGDEAVKTLGDVAVEANEAAESLRSVDGNSDLKIKLNVSDIENESDKIAALDSTIAEMNGVKAKVDVDPSEVEYANSIIEYCVMQKQSLSEPAVMKVDVSQVGGEMGEAISLLQQFQEAENSYEIAVAVGADTSAAEAKITALTAQIGNIDPEIQATLGIDSTSEESVRASISALSAETLTTKANIDSSAIDAYVPENKSCSVVYTADTSSLPTSFSTLTRYVNYVAIGNARSGGSSLNGTAHAGGTAKVGGDWGTAAGGKTLVGELGREIVVDPHTGRWYTVGDNGAEFADIPKGSIVFNHLQTEDLLAHGYVSGRAAALVGGTAMVSGGYRKHNNANSSYNYSGGSSGSSDSSSSYSDGYSSGSSSSSSSSSSDDSSNNSKVIDWIEVLIDRIEHAIDKLSTVAESSFRKLAERLNASSDEIDELVTEEQVQNQAYGRYIEEANKVSLSDGLKEKVRDGTVDINEYDSDTAEKIEEYQKWYEKALSSEKSVLQLRESIAKEYANRFENVQTDFENKLSLKEHLTNTYNNAIDDIEERGYLTSGKLYSALAKTEKQNISIQNKELASLTKKMSEAISSGYIEEGSEQWYEMQEEINSVKESIQEANTKLVEYNNNLRKTKWDRFDYLQEQISDITTESEFLIDLLSNSELYEKNGSLTDTGLATVGLRGQNYNTYMAQADKHAAEIKKLDKEIAKDPYNTTLLERREELLEAQQDSILAAEDEKQAIVSLVEDGIEKELSSLQDLIDKYEDSLDTAKDLYDYQKKVKNQTSEIASLQKQLSAYAGDDSEENKATVQKLKVDLEDALDDLEETQHENYISEQKKLLSDLYDEYENVLNERLDNVDALITDMIDTVNANSASIAATLSSEADKVGYTITDNEKSIWNNEGGAYSVIAKYGDSFLSQITSLNAVISSISAKVSSMVKTSDTEAEKTISSTSEKTAVDKKAQKKTTVKKTENNTANTNKPTALTEEVKRGIATAIWINGNSSGWGSGDERKNKLNEKFGSSGYSEVQGYLDSNWRNLVSDWYSNGSYDLSKYSYSAFKKGGLADYTGVAWLDGTPTEPEMVLNANDTENFIALKDALSKIASGDSSLVDLLSGNTVLEALSKIDSPSPVSSQSFGDINYQVTIPIDHVENYNDFMNQMSKDGKFEKLVKSMTVDRLAGGSKISKNKYKW